MGVLSRGLAEGCHWAGAPQRPTLPLLTSAGGACASGRGWGGPTHHLPSPFILSSARRPTLPPARAAGSLPPLQVTLVIWFPAGLKAAWLPSLAVLASVLAVQSRRCSSSPLRRSPSSSQAPNLGQRAQGRRAGQPGFKSQLGYLPTTCHLLSRCLRFLF